MSTFRVAVWVAISLCWLAGQPVLAQNELLPPVVSTDSEESSLPGRVEADGQTREGIEENEDREKRSVPRKLGDRTKIETFGSGRPSLDYGPLSGVPNLRVRGRIITESDTHVLLEVVDESPSRTKMAFLPLKKSQADGTTLRLRNGNTLTVSIESVEESRTVLAVETATERDGGNSPPTVLVEVH